MKKKLVAMVMSAVCIASLAGCGAQLNDVPVVEADYSYRDQLEPQDVVSDKIVQEVIIDETQVDPDESYTWAALRSRLGLSFLDDNETSLIYRAAHLDMYDLDRTGHLGTEYVTEPLRGSDGNTYLYLKGKYYQCDNDGYVEMQVSGCDALNFRVGPSTSNEIIGTISNGGSTFVRLSAHMSDGSTWYRVKNRDGQLGWQHSYYIRPSANAVEKPADVILESVVSVTNDGEIIANFPEFDKSRKSLTAAYVLTHPYYILEGEPLSYYEENGYMLQMLRKIKLDEGEEAVYYGSFAEVKVNNPNAREGDYGWYWVPSDNDNRYLIYNHCPCLEGLQREYAIALEYAERDAGQVTINLITELEEERHPEPEMQTVNPRVPDEPVLTKQEPHKYVDMGVWPYFTEAKTAAEQASEFYWPNVIKRQADTDTIVFEGAGFHNEQVDLSSENLVLLTNESLCTDAYSPASKWFKDGNYELACGYVLLDNAEVWALVPLYDYDTSKVVKHGWVYVTTLLGAEEYLEQSNSWFDFFFHDGYKATTGYMANTRLNANSYQTINATGTVEDYVTTSLSWLAGLKQEAALQ